MFRSGHQRANGSGGPSGRLAGEERVVLLFLTEGRDGPVPTGEDGVAGQRENFLTVVAILFGEVSGAATHGTGENRITDDGERPTQAGDVERRHAG